MSYSEPFEKGKRWYYKTVVEGEISEFGPFKSRAGAKTSQTKAMRREERAARRRADVRGLERGPLRAYDRTLQWWGEILAGKAAEVYERGDGDHSACRELTALAAAAKAAHGIHDTSQMESEVEELQEFRDQIKQQRRHGIRVVR